MTESKRFSLFVMKKHISGLLAINSCAYIVPRNIKYDLLFIDSRLEGVGV